MHMPNGEAVITFTDMAYGGDAVGRHSESGAAVFAWPGIEGEQARVAITAHRKNLVRGLVTQVIEPSPLRVEPLCPYFGPCGGCQWQHIGYEGQVRFKHDILRTQLTRLGGVAGADLEAVLKPPVGSPRPYNYRNTSHFAIASPARSLGYFMRDTHSVIPIALCPISNPGINGVIPLINSLLAEAPPGGQPAALPHGAHGIMRVWQVTIRSSEATGQTLVVFHSRAEGASTPRAHGREQPGARSGRPRRSAWCRPSRSRRPA